MMNGVLEVRAIVAVVVTGIEHFEERAFLAARALRGRGFETTALLSDFLHFEKRRKTDSPPPGAEYVHMPSYRRNLSAARIFSMLAFSARAYRRLEALRPDALYVIAPPNSLGWAAARYKRKHPDARVIVDVNDMWPESLPVPGALKGLFPLRLWRALRRRGVKAADAVVAECALFADTLKDESPRAPVVAYMPCGADILPSAPEFSDGILRLGYLGSVNNIIDIDRIAALIRALCRRVPVELIVVGDGEKRADFEAAARAAGARVCSAGAVFDPAEKQRLFDRCDFALNVMKPSVCVGLTMKSVDYFRMGVPVLNAIARDTTELVARYGAGLNLSGDAEADAGAIVAVTREENAAMRENGRTLFRRELSADVFYARVSDILARALVEKGEGA